LSTSQRRQPCGAWMNRTSEKSSPTKVHDESGILVEDDWPALETRSTPEISLVSNKRFVI
jgi:hypothetical protein